VLQWKDVKLVVKEWLSDTKFLTLIEQLTEYGKPNLQPVVITVNGKSLKVKVCTKVLKTLKSATEVETMQILKANKNNLSPRIQKFLSK